MGARWGIGLSWQPNSREFTTMARVSVQAQIDKLDTRLTRVEQILPTLVTKDDLQAFGVELRTELRTEIRDAGSELRTDLRAEMQDMGTQLRTELRAEMRAGMKELGDSLRTEMRVLNEYVCDKIDKVIDAYASVNERVTRVELASEDRDAALDRRVTRLEATRRR